MKSKITKIQILKKGIAILMASMFTFTPIAYATTSLDDSYLQSSWLEQILYGTVGSTANEIKEWFSSGHTTLYIQNETQLRALAEYVNNGNSCEGKQIKLLNNIEVNSDVEWVPIGNVSNKFNGTFDGQGKTISGINFNRNNKSTQDISYVGLFGYASSSAIIRNVKLAKSDFNLKYNISSDILYDSEDLLTYESPNFKFKYYYLGGIVGCNSKGIIENCHIEKNVYINGLLYVGGIAGLNNGGLIQNCTNKGDVSGAVLVGGITGANIGNNTNTEATFNNEGTAKVISCINEGNVYGLITNVGGISGSASKNAIIQKSENLGKISVAAEGVKININGKIITYASQNVGGIAGLATGSSDTDSAGKVRKYYAAIDACINNGEVKGYRDVGGIVGQLAGESIGGYAIFTNNINYSLDIEGGSYISTGYLAGRVSGFGKDEKEGTDDDSYAWLAYNFYVLSDNQLKNLDIAENEIDAASDDYNSLTTDEIDNIKRAFYVDSSATENNPDNISNDKNIFGYGANRKNCSIKSRSTYIIYKDADSNYYSIFKNTADDTTKILLKNLKNADYFFGTRTYKTLDINNTETTNTLKIDEITSHALTLKLSNEESFKINENKWVINNVSSTGNTEEVEDTTKPLINTEIYVENALETGRYTAGKEILFKVTTTEAIKDSYTLPEMQVSFSESGVGKYNYDKDTNKVGYAKCIDARINLDGTTTWTYSYQVQEFDEGQVEFEFIAGKITDLAGNVTAIKNLYTPSASVTSDKITESDWGTDLSVTFEFYKNSVSEANKVTSQTYFTDEDDLIVVATYDKVLYVHYGLSDGKNTNIRLNNTYKDRAPSLYLNADSALKQSSISSVETEDKTTRVKYTFSNIAKDYGLKQLTQVKSVVLKNENNGEAVTYNNTTVSTNGLIPYAEKYYETYKDEEESLYNKTLTSEKTKKLTELDDILIDPESVSQTIEKSEIYADTTAPTVKITAEKSNPTNADLITYTFEFSEKVEGFTADKVTVNGGNKNTKEETTDGKTTKIPDFTAVTKGLKYELKVEPTVTNGNEGEVQVIVEEGAVKDLVGINNVRQESIIKVDKKAPTVEIKSNKNIVTDEKIKYEFIWSESVTGFETDDITVTNGEKGTLTGEGNYYTLEVTAKNGNDLEVSVGKDKCNDVAGNNNIASGKHVIPVAPSVKITTNTTSNPTNVSSITYTFTWSEKVTGFDVSDIILPNGVTGTLKAGQDNTYTMTVDYNSLISNGNEGEVTVAVKENAVQDSNGNQNTYVSNTTKIDRIAPIFVGLEAHVDSKIELNSEIDTVKEYYKAGDQVVITATFTENVENSTAPTLVLKFSESGNSVIPEGTIKGNKITYTYTIAKGDQGTLSVRGFSGAVKDNAGNTTTVGKKTLDGNTIIADTKAPTLKELNVKTDKGTYNAGKTITIEAIYDEEVFILTNNEIKNITSELAPILKVKFENGEEKEATFTGYVGEDKTKLKYTVSIVDGDNGKLSITSYENKENIKVCDIAGNNASLNIRTTGNEITADTQRPVVENITAVVENPSISGTDIYYKKGNNVKITLTFSENVSSAVLMPKIIVGFSEEAGKEPTKYNDYAYESDWNANSKTIEYSYTIQDDDNGYLWVKVPEGQFKDIAGNVNVAKEATLISNIYADTIGPYLSTNTNQTTQWQIEYVTNEDGQATGIKATGIFNEKVFSMNGNTLIGLNDVPVLGMFVNNSLAKTVQNATITTKANKESNLDDQTILTYNIDIRDIDTTGNISVNFIDGTVYDRAGNKMSIDLINGDITSPIFKDVKVVTTNDFYKAGENIEIFARFIEETKLTEVPILEVKLGEKTLTLNGKYSPDDSSENIKVAKYTYKILPEDNGELNVISLIGRVSDGVRGNSISKIYIDLTNDEKNDVNTEKTELLNSNENNYANNNKEYKNVFADNIKPYITSVEAIIEGKTDTIAKYTKEDGKDAVTNVGRTNVNELEYVITFNEPIEYINESAIKLYNAEKVAVEYHYTNTTNKHYDKITIKVKTTTEGVQSLIFDEGIFADRARNANEKLERFNMVTTDFTKPTVRFISEYNGGTYVLPTNINKVEIRPNVEISEDIAKIEYKWDKEEYVEIENYSSSSDIAIPTKAFTNSGEKELFIRVEDLAGNVYETSKKYNILKSNIGIELSTYEYTNQDVTATVSFEEGLTDNRKVTFKPEGSNELIELNAKGTTEKGTEYTITTNGIIYAEATDRVGNKVFTQYEITNIDKEKPEVELSLNGANLVIGTGKDKATIKTNIKVSEPVTIEYYWNGEDTTGGWIENPETSQTNITELELNTSSKSGIHYLNVKAIDKAGNETVVKSNPFTVVDTNERVDGENTIPAEKPVSELIIFEQMKEDEKDKAYVYVNHDYSIIKDLYVTLEDETYGYIGEYNNVELYGNTTIKVQAWDACGNRVYNEYKVADIEGPEFTITGNPEGWVNSDVRLEVICGVKLEALTVDGNDILSKDSRVNSFKDITKYGSYKFEAIDIYGNTSEQTIEVKIDKSDPEITDVKIEDGKIVIEANDIDKTLNKELSGLAEYAITDTTEVPVEWSKSNEINVTKDANFFVWVKDNAGNITPKEQVVVRDITAPEITITTDIELDKWTNTDVKLNVEANEELSSLVVKYKETVEQEGGNTEVEKEENILDTKTYTITSNGTYKIVGTDKSGNATEKTIIVAKIDKAMPEITEVKAEGRDITITATDADSEVAEYAITDTTEEPVEWSKSNVIKVTKDGEFYAWVKDNAGNVTRAENSIIVDTVELKLEITGNPTEWTNKDVELVVKANKELKTLKMGETQIDLSNAKVTITENGEYAFVAEDLRGNIVNTTVVVAKIDKAMPEITEVKAEGRDITITATDADSEVAEYAITDTTEEPVEWSKSNVIKVTKDGTFYVWVKDNAGNTIIAKTVDEQGNETITQIMVDTAAPILAFSYLSQTITVGMPVEAIVTTNENAKISYSLDNKTWIDSEELISKLSISEKSTTVGKVVLYVKATDKVGNESEVETLEFNVVNMEEIRQPEIVFEDIPTLQINGVRYVKVPSDATVEYLTNSMNKEALCGVTPEYTKLTDEKDLRTGSEIALNGSTKYIIIVEGDVNCDGKVTFDDIIKTNAIRISENENNISKAQLLAADINNTGKIEFKDIININAIRLNAKN